MERDVPRSGAALEQLEEVDLVRRVQQGDEVGFAELVRRYRPLTRRKSHVLFLDGHDKDDLYQEALVGLWNAIRAFDVQKKTPFIAFANLCIERQLCTAIKTGTRHKHRPLNSASSLEAIDGIGQGRPAAIGRDADEPVLRVIALEELEALRACFLVSLSELEREVLGLFVDGQSYEEIASSLQTSLKAIDNALQRVRKKLRNHLATREREEGIRPHRSPATTLTPVGRRRHDPARETVPEIHPHVVTRSA